MLGALNGAHCGVENMERPARDCKDRHKPILLMRHGGA